jgi:WD40 repeat protein
MGNLVIGCIIGEEVRLRVWDLNIPHELVMRRDVEGNPQPTCLAACYPYIALGTQTGYVHVWDILKEVQVAKVRVHGRGVRALLFWEGCIISGSYEGSIGVYNIEQKSLLMQLQAASGVNALLIAGGNLYSAHNDGFVRAWTLGTWTPLPGLQIPNASKCTCLALSGRKLLCGCELPKEKGLLVVINMQSLQVEHTVALSEPPRDLLCVSGKVFCTLRDYHVILFE